MRPRLRLGFLVMMAAYGAMTLMAWTIRLFYAQQNSEWTVLGQLTSPPPES